MSEQPKSPFIPPHEESSATTMDKTDSSYESDASASTVSATELKAEQALTAAEDTASASEDAEDIHTGRWAAKEHEQFLIGYEKYGKDWKRISEFMGTRSNVQCRTHAQKFFKKRLFSETSRSESAEILDEETSSLTGLIAPSKKQALLETGLNIDPAKGLPSSIVNSRMVMMPAGYPYSFNPLGQQKSLMAPSPNVGSNNGMFHSFGVARMQPSMPMMTIPSISGLPNMTSMGPRMNMPNAPIMSLQLPFRPMMSQPFGNTMMARPHNFAMTASSPAKVGGLYSNVYN